MKKYFITGLALLLPLTLTLIIVLFLFNLLTNPFTGVIRGIFDYYGIFSNGFWFLSAYQLRALVSKIIILVLLFFFTIFIGMIGRWFLIRYMIHAADKLFHRIPFIGSVYMTCKDVIQTIFTSTTKSFKQVVFVPFPNEHTYSLGLITKETLAGLEGTGFTDATAVFVPTTPNPTSGFLMLYHPDEIIFLDMPIEDALKYTISCGVIMSSFRVMTKEEAMKRAEELKEQERQGEI